MVTSGLTNSPHPARHQHRCKSRVQVIDHPFTLVELLIVVSILTILMAMLLPVLRHTRSLARRVQCTSNLRQLVTGTLVYADDQDGEFPSHKWNSSSWPWGLSDWGMQNTRFYADYLPVRDLYFCPQDLANTPLSEAARCYPYFPGKEPAAWRVNISYCYFFGRDGWFPEKPNARGGEISLKSVKEPSRSTVLADVMRFGKAPAYHIISNWNHKKDGAAITTIDRAGGNMGYADGHVGWMEGAGRLLAHRQKMKGNDNKSYAAEQPHDSL